MFFHKTTFTQESLYCTQLLRSEACTHRGAFIHRSFCTFFLYTEASEAFTHTQKLLHTEAFTQKMPLNRGAFTHRRVYKEESLHTKVFTQGSFYTQILLHRVVFYTEKSLHKEVLTQRSMHTQRLLHREAFYTEQLFHRGAFTQRNF